MADSSSRTRVRSDQRCAVSHLQHEFFSNFELNISHNYFDYTLPLITVEIKNNRKFVSGGGGGWHRFLLCLSGNFLCSSLSDERPQCNARVKERLD